MLEVAGTVVRLSPLIDGTGDPVLPVSGKVGGSVKRANGQLDKAGA
jgi:hypothetical protein